MAEYTVQDLQDNLNYINETKSQIKQAIIDKGQVVEDSATFRSYVDKIKAIETGIKTDDATATPDDLISPKTAYVGENKITGTMIPEYFEDEEVKFDFIPEVSTGYYVFDFLSELNIGIVSSAENPSSVIVCKWDVNAKGFDSAHGLTINKNSRFSNITGAKFSRVPLLNNVYQIMIVGTCADGEWDRKPFQVVRVNLDTLSLYSENGYSAELEGRIYHSYWWYEATTFNIAASPTDPNLFYAGIQSNARMGEHGVIRIVTTPTGMSFAENNTSGNLNYNRWFQFSQDGRYMAWYYNSTSLGAVIDCNTGSAVKTGLGMHCIIPRGDSYLIFRNYNLYDWNGTLLKSYGSSVLGQSYTYCFYLDNMLMVSNASKQSYFSILDDYTLVKLGESTVSFNLTGYSTAINKATVPVYDKDKIIFGASTKGLLYFADAIRGDTNIISSLTRGTNTLYSSLKTDALPSNVLNGKKYISTNGMNTGTMPNNGALTYTPTTRNQAIPLGYTSGGTVIGDENLIPENIKKDVTIFGVDGIATGVDTTDATATANDIVAPKTAYVNEEKITGNIHMEYKSDISEAILSTDLSKTSLTNFKVASDLEHYLYTSGSTLYIGKIVSSVFESPSTTIAMGISSATKLSMTDDSTNMYVWVLYTPVSHNDSNTMRVKLITVNKKKLTATHSNILTLSNYGLYTLHNIVIRPNNPLEIVIGTGERDYTGNTYIVYTDDGTTLVTKNFGRTSGSTYYANYNLDGSMITRNTSSATTTYTITADHVYQSTATGRASILGNLLTNGTTTYLNGAAVGTSALGMGDIYNPYIAKTTSSYYKIVNGNVNKYTVKDNSLVLDRTFDKHSYTAIVAFHDNVVIFTSTDGLITISEEVSNIPTNALIYGTQLYNTEDADAIANNIELDKVVYNKNGKVVGTVPAVQSIGGYYSDIQYNPTETEVRLYSTSTRRLILIENSRFYAAIPIEKLAEFIGLTADKIKAGETILGVVGTYEGEASVEQVTEQAEVLETQTTSLQELEEIIDSKL